MVLHLHLGVELIFDGKVEVAILKVDANDGGNAKACLCALQIHTVAVAVKLIQTLETGLSSSQLCLALGLHGSELLCSVLTRLGSSLQLILHLHHASAYLTVDGIDVALQKLSEVDSTGRGHYIDVAQSGTVGSVAIQGAETSVNRPVLINLIGSTQLEAEVVLAASHKGIHIIALNVEPVLLQQSGNAAHGTLEGAESIVELTDAATARHGKVELIAPVALIIGCLYGWYKRSIGNAFELLDVLALVFLAHAEHVVGRGDGTRLVCILPVEGNVETLWHESYTGRVGIDAINADSSIAGGVLQE